MLMVSITHMGLSPHSFATAYTHFDHKGAAMSIQSNIPLEYTPEVARRYLGV